MEVSGSTGQGAGEAQRAQGTTLPSLKQAALTQLGAQAGAVALVAVEVKRAKEGAVEVAHLQS